MKACVLAYKSITKSKKLYMKLLEEMKKRFDSVLMIPIEKVSMQVDKKGVSVTYRGEELDKFQAILPRIGPTYVPYGYLVLKSLEKHTYFPNTPESYLIASDKFHTLMKLSEHGVPVPKTLLSVSRKLAKANAKELGAPQVIKTEKGSGGKGVVYAKDVKSTKTILDALSVNRGEKIMVEEFLPNPGEDIRLYVIGGEVHAAGKRVASKDDIRSNIHAGGKYKKFDPDARTKQIAIKASKIIGADICGVDVIMSNGEPYIIECNMNPGFFISKITGVNLFKRITDYVYFNAKKFYSEDDTLSDFIARSISFFKRYQ